MTRNVEEAIPRNHHKISCFAELRKEGTELRKEI